MNFKSHRPARILALLGLIVLTPAIGFAADVDFAGTWKGQVKVEVPEVPGGSGNIKGPDSVAVPDGTGGTRSIAVIPDVANSEIARGGTSRNVDLTRQGSRGNPKASPPKTHMLTVKITLRINVDKNGKFSGYLLTGNSYRWEVQEWNTDGNKLTFVRIGLNGMPLENYTAVLNDKELNVRQTPAFREDVVREFTLKR